MKSMYMIYTCRIINRSLVFPTPPPLIPLRGVSRIPRHWTYFWRRDPGSPCHVQRPDDSALKKMRNMVISPGTSDKNMEKMPGKC